MLLIRKYDLQVYIEYLYSFLDAAEVVAIKINNFDHCIRIFTIVVLLYLIISFALFPLSVTCTSLSLSVGFLRPYTETVKS